MHSLSPMIIDTLQEPEIGLVNKPTGPALPLHKVAGPVVEDSAQPIISGFRKELVEFRVWLRIGWLGLKNYQNPLKVLKAGKGLAALRRRFMGQHRIRKVAQVNGRYFWDLYTPGWPSASFDRFHEAEMSRITPIPIKTNRFTNIYLAITKKCSLRCEHCFEWEALNGREKLSLPDLKQIVQRFQEMGVAQIHLSGGEPMLRVPDMAELLQSAGKETDFWVLTSGLNFTLENARKLKKAGLTGAFISLDHFEPEVHNLFRGSEKSFAWVQEAVRNAKAVDLLTCLSVCVTRAFVTEANLMAYARLAKEMGVAFIQVLEPKAVGHYKGKEVALQPEQIQLLEEFYLKLNFDKQFKDYPIICYHGYYQRQIGCFASGNRSLYIDTDGDLHACPFCQTKMGNALAPDIDMAIEQLQSAGCHSFRSFQE
jgi:MoaA/NifB/PqqE/SkfB family radical SAM enzyme